MRTGTTVVRTLLCLFADMLYTSIFFLLKYMLVKCAMNPQTKTCLYCKNQYQAKCANLVYAAVLLHSVGKSNRICNTVAKTTLLLEKQPLKH